LTAISLSLTVFIWEAVNTLRAIARQHHGSVSCDDCDTGAHFTLELPAADTSIAPPAATSRARR
jgi:hypothetical protein